MEEAILSNIITASSTTPQPQKTTTSSGLPSSGWWGLGWNILDTVKKQTENVITIYTEDLQEFTKTLKDDVKDVITKTVATNNLANANPAPQKSKMDELELSLDRKQARVTALQNELSTFVTEPTEVQDFQEWKSTWNIQTQTEQISKLLAENEKMRAIHTKLVPVVISYATFWERYFFKLHKLLLEEERRAVLLQKAVATTNDEEELAWDDETEDASPRKEAIQETEPVVPKAELEDYFDKLDMEDKEQAVPSSNRKKETSQLVVIEEQQHPDEASQPVVTHLSAPSSPASPETPSTPTVNTTTKSEGQEEAWDSWE